MRITSKGQVTIPRAIREKAGLLPKTEVEFAYIRGVVTLRRAGRPTGVGRSVVERLRGSLRRKRKSTDELMALTRAKD